MDPFPRNHMISLARSVPQRARPWGQHAISPSHLSPGRLQRLPVRCLQNSLLQAAAVPVRPNFCKWHVSCVLRAYRARLPGSLGYVHCIHWRETFRQHRRLISSCLATVNLDLWVAVGLPRKDGVTAAWVSVPCP